MKTDNRPIGIFDSGIGGLTVAAAIARAMPDERIVYFGDTAHLPYGEKSVTAIKSYSTRILEFLKSKNCKAVVIACNTASAVAGPLVKKLAGKQIPVVNVIDPTSAYVAEKFSEGKIGVIATKATVNSRIYAKRITKANESLKVTMLATPLLVSMIEEGFFNNNISQAIINDYLSRPNLKGVSGLILGCTHFPLIKSEVQTFYTDKTEVIDSTEIVANFTKELLEKRGMTADKKTGAHHFYVSDLTPSFAESTKIFFGKKLKLVQKELKH
jgi:glutamate racemase